MSHQNDTLGTIWMALVANSLVAVTKGIGAFYSGSGALLAETVHSVADAGNYHL